MSAQGALFTTDWLKEGITATAQWQALDGARIAELWSQSHHLLDELLKRKNPTDTDTEADTEQKLIYPLLGPLGWDHISVQQNHTVRGRKDVPDAPASAECVNRFTCEHVNRELTPRCIPR